MLFLSESAVFADGRAIRGGVPVCFPQLANRGPLTARGFARTSRFAVAARSAAAATLVLRDSPATSASAWPHAFELAIDVEIRDRRFEQAMRARNPSAEAPFEFTGALHTYLAAPAGAAAAAVVGLGADARFLDSAAGGAEARVTLGEVAFPPGAAVDRIYAGAPGAGLKLRAAGAPRVATEKAGFQDFVVRSPASTAAFPDLSSADGFVCVEDARTGSGPATVAPGGEWVGRQALAFVAAA
jgi:glucose-6-phosphate 1-epimerase